MKSILQRYAESYPQRLAQANRQASVMSKQTRPEERWRPETEYEPPLEAPMISPDDLIGSGIPTKLAMLAKAGLSKGALSALGAGVIKNKGGNWLGGSVEGALSGLKRGLIDNGETMIHKGLLTPEQVAKRPEIPLNNWINRQLTKYVKNEMATPEDPIRALAERGITHAQLNPHDIVRGNAVYERQARGFPTEGMAKSDLAKLWEDASDAQIGAELAKDWRKNASPETLAKIPGQERIPDTTPIWEKTNPNLSGNLGFNHLIDELSNAINPESGLPRHLQFPADRLDKVSVPQAVERVAEINAWRKALKVEEDLKRANNAATVLHKEYPDKGMKWVELTSNKDVPAEGYSITPIDAKNGRYWKVEGPGFKYPSSANTEAEAIAMTHKPALADALKYEGDTMGHCVGGYCDDVVSGRSRIYSLRDAKGQPHVTIEVAPTEHINYSSMQEGNARGETFENDMFKALLQYPELKKWVDYANYDDPELAKYVEQNIPELYGKYFKTAPQEQRIVQIKGKGNAKPIDEYLPFVQDFVRSGQWSDVGDLQNTGLMRSKFDADTLKRYGKEPQEYLTQQELDDIMKAIDNSSNFAHGGSVRPNKTLTVQDLSAIISALESGYQHG